MANTVNEHDLMPHMTLREIADACEGTYIGSDADADICITGVVRDNRDVQPGNLFVAIPGERVDGHRFIPDAYARGAVCVLAQKKPEAPGKSANKLNKQGEDEKPYILVKSTLDAMKKLAAWYRSMLDIKVVGITGSVGKTSTKEMIASVLSQKYSVLKTEGNYNNEIGLPLTIFKIRKEHQIAVLEMGISDFGEMHRLAAMAQPDICVITNIGFCHLENLGTQEGILNAKTECFDHMKPDGIAILNGDDALLRTKSVVNGKPAVFYGIGATADVNQASAADANKSLAADVHQATSSDAYKATSSDLHNGEVFDMHTQKTVYATDIEHLGFEGMQAQIHTPQGEFIAQIPIPGEHNVYNALAATAVGLQLGLTLEEIASGIASVETIQGRMHFIEADGVTIIDDCYNANPVSMKAGLELLSYAKGRSVAVLGDMGELGTNEKALHHEVGVYAGEIGLTAVFAAGQLAQEYIKGIQEVNTDCEVHYYTDRDSMTAALLSYVQPGDSVLVKASHFMDFPKVVEALQLYRPPKATQQMEILPGKMPD